MMIYLDNNGSTAIDKEVYTVFINDLKESYGNPSSMHSFGQAARNRLVNARRIIAEYLQVKPQELSFTSGGTEGLNMVLRGLFHKECHENSPKQIITSTLEHSAIYSTVKYLESAKRCQATFLSPGLKGAVTAEAVSAALRPETQLIALTAVNGETGIKTEIEEIASLAKKAGVAFLVDGVALLGKEIFHIPEGVTAICFSGHKLHAPKGTGVTFIRSSLKLSPILTGGPQEYNRRAGTENVSGAVALAKAIEMLKTALPTASDRMEYLRNKFEKAILGSIQDVVINGEGNRIVNVSNLAFTGVDGESLLMGLDREGVAASHGSACASGAREPSRILLNMGIPLPLARSSVRFSLSRFTTEQEIDLCTEIIIKLVARLRR